MDKNKLWFKFYIPSNLGLVNIYKIIVIDSKKENKTTATKSQPYSRRFFK